jgi:calcium binding protein 39
MNFFKTRQRTPAELVRALLSAITRLDTSSPGSESRKKVCVLLSFLYGIGEAC